MIGQELIIAFKHDKAYLTSDKALGFEQLNLPEIAKSFKSAAFWTIKVLNFNQSEKKLFVEILSYQIGATEFPYNQLQLADKLNAVEKVTFRSIDTSGLLSTLSATTALKILPSREAPVSRYEAAYEQPLPIVREPLIQTIKETFFFL